MKMTVYRLLGIWLCLSISFGAPAPASALAANLAPSQEVAVIPTFTIINIIPDTSITVLTYNFPANQEFEVLMGFIGSRGVGGIRAATFFSGAGGSFTATFNIPAALAGVHQIAVRLQSLTKPNYFAYNWFYNRPSSSPVNGVNVPVPALPGYEPPPTFSTSNVVKDVSVSIVTQNFPANKRMDVLMGYIGTRGVNGIYVGTVATGIGGSLSFTFNIPPALRGLSQIAIRLQSADDSKYYAYNWFYNHTADYGSGPFPPAYSGYGGVPTFSIASVIRDVSVTIITYNLPPNEQFQVTMGPIGTRGIGGLAVATIDSGSGGSQTLTFNIPPALAGLPQIAIRLQSVTGSGYYAYNWFFNANL
jgi:hypothetical protein